MPAVLLPDRGRRQHATMPPTTPAMSPKAPAATQMYTQKGMVFSPEKIQIGEANTKKGDLFLLECIQNTTEIVEILCLLF